MRPSDTTPTADPRPTDLDRWFLPELFPVRVAGLPMDVVDGLRAPKAVAWAETALELEAGLESGARSIADAIEEAVSGIEDTGVRRELLRLRRDVHNVRLPSREGSGLAALPAATASRARAWIDDRRRYEDHLRDGDEIVASDLAAARDHLRGLADHPRLRAGLVTASPVLDRHLDTFARSDGSSPRKRERQQERSLLDYLYRSACKTSPFSFFTAVGLGRLCRDDGAVLEAGAEPWTWRSYPRLNLTAIGRLTELVLASPACRADLPVELTSGWQIHEERIRYTRREARPLAGDAINTADLVHEELFYLQTGPVLAEVLGLLSDSRQMRFEDLVEVLHGRDPAARPHTTLVRFLDKLLELGLLTVPCLHLDIHASDPVRRFVDGLAVVDRSWSRELCERLVTVSDQVSDYGSAPPPRRRELLGAIGAELGHAARALGGPDVRMPGSLLFEDVTTGTASVTGDRSAWSDTFVSDLQELCRILPLFDVSLPQKLTMNGYFRARYGTDGRTDDVVDFAHRFHQDLYDEYQRASRRRRDFDDDLTYVPQLNWQNLPEIDALDRARRRLVEGMRRIYATSDGVSELVLDQGTVDAVAEALPDRAGLLDPYSFFLQIGRHDDGPLAVVNRVYSGLTLLYSRFTHCLDDGTDDGLVAHLRWMLDHLSPEGAVFAELTGGHETTNLNLHSIVTSHEIVCPGERSERPAAEQIHLDDLSLVRCPESGRMILRCRRLGVEVIPVYLGFLMPSALPKIQRLLLNMSYASMGFLDFWGGTDRPLGADDVGGHPRLRFRDIVLQRRLWKIRTAGVPTFTSAEGAGRFLAWRRWRRDHGVPARVFATAAVGRSGVPHQPRVRYVESTKPQYVDFESPHSVDLLDRMARAAGERLVLTEMLPDQDDLWVSKDGRHHVTELTVELDGIRG